MKNYEAINLWERIPGVKNFYWYEALRLPKWGIHAFPEDRAVYQNIISVASRLQWIRDFFGKSVIITSWYRPENYNRYLKDVHGYKVATRSTHLDASGVDWRLYGINTVDGVNQVKSELYPHLEDLQCRMSMNDDQGWIHNDIKSVGGFTY